MKARLAWFVMAAALAPAAWAQVDVGVSIGIQQPGVYGRIEIGNMAPPPVVYARPLLIAPAVVAVQQQPMYLYVPPGHQKNWSRHCARYGACGQPVYFVREQWIAQRYEEHHGKPRGKGKKSKGKHGDD
jgi:hypothetical protein